MRIAQIKDGVVANIIIVDPETYELAEGDVKSDEANIGDTYDGEKFIPQASSIISENDALRVVKNICDDKIAKAYSHDGAMRRVSLYGYFAFLNYLASEQNATDNQLADRSVLVAAAEWEEKMISAIPKIAASLDVSEIVKANWPELNPDVAKKLTALAAVS